MNKIKTRLLALPLLAVLAFPLDKQGKDQYIYNPETGRSAIQLGSDKYGPTMIFELGRPTNQPKYDCPSIGRTPDGDPLPGSNLPPRR